MASFTKILFGDYLDVTDQGGGVIRVDSCAETGTGIQFDKSPQVGGYLEVTTNTSRGIKIESQQGPTGLGFIELDAGKYNSSLAAQQAGEIDLNAYWKSGSPTGGGQINMYADSEIGLYTNYAGMDPLNGATGDIGLYAKRDNGFYSERDGAIYARRDAYVVAGSQAGVAEGANGGDLRLEANNGSYAPGNIYLIPDGNLIWNGPTTDPGVAYSVWNYYGILQMSGATGPPILIGELILAAPAGTITFSSVPQYFDGLFYSAQVSVTGSTVAQDQIRLNNDSAARYHWVQNYANGNTPTSAWDGNVLQTIGRVCEAPPTSADTQVPASSVVYLGGYSGSVQRKTYVGMFGLFNTHAQAGSVFGSYNQTAAITQVDRVVSTGSYDTGSRFHIYGMPKFPGSA